MVHHNGAGAFYSAEDADSLVSPDSDEKVEGAFYVWEYDEVIRALGEQDGKIFAHRYGYVRPRPRLAGVVSSAESLLCISFRSTHTEYCRRGTYQRRQTFKASSSTRSELRLLSFSLAERSL